MDISIYFMHPTDGRVVNVTVDNSITGYECVGELIANEFIIPNCEGYNFAIVGGNQLDNTKSLSENKVKENDTLRILPTTDAGGYYSPTETVPGFEKIKQKEFDVKKFMKSDTATEMLVHLYQDSLKESKELYKELEKSKDILLTEKLKNSNRLVVSLILIISQIIIGLGCSIIVNEYKLGLYIVIIGFSISVFGTIFSFYRPKNKSKNKA